MEEFVFYRDTECTVWTRERYTIEAKSMEEARRILAKRNKDVQLEEDEFEILRETLELTDREEWIDEQGDTFSIED